MVTKNFYYVFFLIFSKVLLCTQMCGTMYLLCIQMRQPIETFINRSLLMKDKTRAVSMRIDERLYESINLASREEHRSLNNMIQRLLESGLAQYRRDKQEKPTDE